MSVFPSAFLSIDRKARDLRMSQTMLHATVPTNGGPVSLHALIATLGEFRGLYFSAMELVLAELGDPDPDLTDEMVQRYARRVDEGLRDEAKLRNATVEEVAQLRGFARNDDFHEDDAELLVLDLERTNPIELAVLGLAFPLSVAVILSGGKLQLGPLKVELQPIGKGIKLLREAVAPLQPLQVKPLIATESVTPPKTKPLPRLKK